MEELSALYSDGQSARQVKCKLQIIDQTLKLNFNNDGYTFLMWPIAELHTVQWNGSLLQVHYGNYPHQSLQIEGDAAKAVHALWAKKKPVQTAMSLNTKKIAAVLVVLMVLFVGLALFSWFVVLPWAAAKAVALVPVDSEISIGESLSKSYSTAESKADSATILLQEFTDQLKLDTIYPIKTELLRSEEINAFALPGGRIFVYSGIVDKMKSYEELVALLGHESSHVSNRHSLKSMSRSAAGSLVIAAVFSDAAGISAGLMDQADQLRQLDYSRDLETEADAQGLQKMLDNKVSGKGMLDLLDLLKTESVEMPAMMKYLSTHPDTDARILAVKENQKSKQQFAPNPTLQALFERIQAKIKQ